MESNVIFKTDSKRSLWELASWMSEMLALRSQRSSCRVTWTCSTKTKRQGIKKRCTVTRPGEESNQENWLVMSHLPDVGITAQLCIEEPSYPTHGLCGTCSGAVWSAQGLNRAKLLRSTNSQPANMRATWIMGRSVGEVRSGCAPLTL